MTATVEQPGVRRRRRLSNVTVTSVITWFAAACFAAILLGILVAVVVNSFATEWRGGWWPPALTLDWYARAWNAPGIAHSIGVTFEVGISVVLVALILGVPAGYVLARKKFPGKSAVLLAMLFPIILPQLTYAVQLAALMYRIGLGGSLIAVILVNLVPALPLVILITIPFVEQISPNVENAARVFGANSFNLFLRVLVPLLTPAVVAAGILCLVRVLGSFELTFFVSNANTQTLVVTIFGALSDPGGVSASLTAAMAVFYMVLAVIGLAVSLRFTNPAQALTHSTR
jgi:putative spermidine/putrescine transport system permease protein